MSKSALPNPDGTPVPSHAFDDLFVTNNRTGWLRVAGHLEAFAHIIEGSVLGSLDTAMRDAERATAELFTGTITAKRENLELGFQAMIQDAKGKSFGSKLIHWSLDKAGIQIPQNLSVTWASVSQQMGSTLEELIRMLEPSLPPTSPPPSPESVVTFIRRHGGMGALHMSFMNRRRTEKADEQTKRENQRRRGAEVERIEKAKEAGFDTPEEHDAAMQAQAEEERKQSLLSKFAELKARLVRNGVMVTDLTPATDGKLLIATDGELYVISESDEYDLLSCAAAVM